MKTMIVESGSRDQLVWKCEKEDFEFGTHLVVEPSQMAVFFRDGNPVEVLGPGTHILETGNLPFLRFFTKLKFGRYFHCQVYFVNQSVQMAVDWWLNQRVRCELNIGPNTMSLPIGASGTMNIQVDPEQTLKFLTYLVGTGSELTRSGIQSLFGSMLNSVIKPYLSNTLRELNAVAFYLDDHTEEVNRILLQRLAPEFGKYGLLLREFFVDTFLLPEEDPSYQQAKLNYDKQKLMAGAQINEIEQAKHRNVMASLEAEGDLIKAGASAKATVLTAQGEAARRNLEGITSIQEHQFDTLNHMIDAGALSGGNSVVGGGLGDMGGIMGDAMRFGASLHMMKEMGGVMKDTMNIGSQVGNFMTAPATAPTDSTTWTCNQGHVNPASALFCPQCGQKKPEPQPADTWTCSQGHVNPASALFCPQCGQKKPEPQPATWTCAQGHVNPASALFCPQCGQRKPEPQPTTWTCSQGHVNPAASPFCSLCGEAKEGK